MTNEDTTVSIFYLLNEIIINKYFLIKYKKNNIIIYNYI